MLVISYLSNECFHGINLWLLTVISFLTACLFSFILSSVILCRHSSSGPVINWLSRSIRLLSDRRRHRNLPVNHVSFLKQWSTGKLWEGKVLRVLPSRDETFLSDSPDRKWKWRNNIWDRRLTTRFLLDVNAGHGMTLGNNTLKQMTSPKEMNLRSRNEDEGRHDQRRDSYAIDPEKWRRIDARKRNNYLPGTCRLIFKPKCRLMPKDYRRSSDRIG